MNVLAVAKKEVRTTSATYTWLEGLSTYNLARKAMLPISAFSDIALGNGASRDFKPLPDGLRFEKFHVGTAAVVGAHGKALGDSVVTECQYYGIKKKVFFRPSNGQAGLVDTMLLCDQGFAPDGKPLVPLLDSESGNPISTPAEMIAAKGVIMEFNGEVHPLELPNRSGIALEESDGRSVSTRIPVFPSLGLLHVFHNDFQGQDRWVASLSASAAFDALAVATAADVSLETANLLSLVRQSPERLIVHGSEAQVDGIAEAIEWLARGAPGAMEFYAADPQKLREEAAQLREVAGFLQIRFVDLEAAQTGIIQPLLGIADRFIALAERLEGVRK